MGNHTQSFESINTKIQQQKVNSIYFEKLKNLRDVEIDFSESRLTAILGPNGYGKSTVIYALACCYQPKSENQTSKHKNNNDLSINYKFTDFFIPTSHSTWLGSSFTLTHSYRIEKTVFDNVTTKYSKDKDRWKPIYARRPARYTSWIGIKTCVPKIEQESRKSLINYSTQTLSGEVFDEVKKQASMIMNREYEQYCLHKSQKKEYIGVQYNSLAYSSLSMGSGEQRIFFILQEIIKAPKYALIIIDEIDLLLHDLALKNLLDFLLTTAQKKELQIIFTTHDQGLVKMSDKIAVKHLYQADEKTFCFSGTKPDAIYRLTGQQERSLEIFVEDDFAKAIINKICLSIGIRKYVSIQEYGAAINCFTLLAGILLKKENVENMLFVLDGDKYKTKEEQEKRIDVVLTGTDQASKAMRNKALSYIAQFVIPEGLSPEKYIHQLIVKSNCQDKEEYREIIEVAKQIRFSVNSHNYINDIINTIGYDRGEGLKVIMDLISISEEWKSMVKEIEEWCISKKNQVKEE